MTKLNPNKTYALIQRGKIHDIFKGSKLPEYNEHQLQIIEAKKDWKVGDSYPKKAETLEEKKEAKLKEIESKRGVDVAAATIKFKGREISSSSEMIELVAQTLSFFGATGKLPSGYFLPDVHGEKVLMNESDIKEFSALLFEYGFRNYEKHFDLKKKVLAANSFSELESDTAWA